MRFVNTILSFCVCGLSTSLVAEPLDSVDGFIQLDDASKKLVRTFDAQLGKCGELSRSNKDYPVKEWLLSLPTSTRKHIMLYHSEYNAFMCSNAQRQTLIDVLQQGGEKEHYMLSTLFRSDMLTPPTPIPWLSSQETEKLNKLLKEYPIVFHAISAYDKYQSLSEK